MRYVYRKNYGSYEQVKLQPADNLKKYKIEHTPNNTDMLKLKIWVKDKWESWDYNISTSFQSHPWDNKP